jgi:hypothetical protein
MLLRRRAMTIVGWQPEGDRAVTVTIAIRGRPSPVEVRLEAQSPAFSEYLALVATTFYLAFANRAIQRAEDAVAARRLQASTTVDPIARPRSAG